MAIRRAYRTYSNWQDSLQVNKPISDMYLKALIAVYNATAIPARDTAIRMCNIHSRNDPDLFYFVILADSTLQWMKNLRNSVFPTGNVKLDKAISRFSYQKIMYGTAPGLPWHTVQLKTDSSVNSLPLGVAMYDPQTVFAVGPSGGAWDGPDIVDSVNANFIQLYYSYKWLDCIDGCDRVHWWTFRVTNSCLVSLEDTGGDLLPVGVGLKENRPVLSGLKAYPNPASEVLALDLPDGMTGVDITLTNVLGQPVLRASKQQNKAVLDIRKLPEGVYYLKAENTQGEAVFKVLKEK